MAWMACLLAQPRRWLLGLAAAGVLAGVPMVTAAAPAAAASAPMPSAATADPLADPALRALELAARATPLAAADALERYAQGRDIAQPQTVFALGLRGALLAARDDRDSAERVLQRLAPQTERDPLAAAAQAWVRASLGRRDGPLHRPIRLLTEAVAALPASAPPLLRWHLVQPLAVMLRDAGQLDDAVRLHQTLISLSDQIGPAWRGSETRTALALVLLQAEQPERAAELQAEAAALAQRSGDGVALSRALTAESFLQERAGNREKELAALTGAIDAARRAGAREYEVLGMANLADHYLLRGDFTTALRLAQQALPLARDLADLNAESVALANTGLALVSLHRLDEGLAVLREAAAIDERANARTNLANLLGEQGRYLERAGYLREAYAAFRRQRALNDELYRLDHQQAVVELQEGFDSRRRQRELALLQRENQLKQTELHNRTLQQRVWAAAVVVGLLLLVVTGLLLRRLRRHSAALAEGNARLRTQSEVDPLTGLANRRHLLRRMQDDNREGLRGALLLVDLDHFKRVNDQHGHAAGDAVLVAVAQRLRATVRDDDLVVRWGGEEFLIVSTALDETGLAVLAQRLLHAIGGSPVAAGETSLTVSGSIGFAAFPMAPEGTVFTWERAIDLVDAALYLAKSHGRNRAYGVRRLQSALPTAEGDLGQRLSTAWRDGEVTLTELIGPALPATAVVPAAATAAADTPAQATASAAPSGRVDPRATTEASR
jgi:diguanylate cyclase (GGDEF)-like protein